MQPSSIRQICRSRNPFTPSIVLRQYFVPSTPAVRSYQRLLSSTSQAIDSNKPEPVEIESTQSFTGNTKQDGAPSPKAPNLRTPKLPEASIKQLPSRTPTQSQPRKRKGSPPISSSLDHKQKYITMKAQDAMDSLEDYTGVVVEPGSVAPGTLGGVAQETDDSKLPWSLHHDDSSLRGHERLSSEIAKFYDYAIPSRYETRARRHLVRQIQSHAQKIFPNVILEVFGSERTGLSLATSDIDLRLVTPEIAVETQGNLHRPSKKQRKELFDYLYKLQVHLLKKKKYILCVIRYSRYPLISLQDKASGVDVQIVLSNDSTASQAITSKYLKVYPYLAQVYTVVKSMFDIRGLSDVFRGGFGGYPLFMMVVASLQLNPPAKADAAHGLLSVLEFWGTFDTTQSGISMEPPELLPKDETIVMRDEVKLMFEQGKITPKPSFLLSLRDPADPTNDLGAKGVSIRHVQATCQHLFQLLQRNIGASNLENLLKPVVGPIFDVHMGRRAKLETRGRQVFAEVPVPSQQKESPLRESEKASETEEVSEEANPIANSAMYKHGDPIASGLGIPSAEKQTLEEEELPENLKSVT